MTLPSKLAAAALLLLGFQATSACNAVLGIERAELDEAGSNDGEPICEWREAKPKTDCEEFRDESCAQECDIGKCLADKPCRDALKVYRRCVGQSCQDKNGECKGCSDESPLAQTVFKCLESKHCNVAGATSLCESYCSCMASRCDESVPGGGLDGCKTACLNGGLVGGFNGYFATPPEPWKVYCLWEHCEVNVTMTNDPAHCPHATGQVNVCGVEPADPGDNFECDFKKGFGNAPCINDADCCSNNCTAGGLCTDPR